MNTWHKTYLLQPVHIAIPFLIAKPFAPETNIYHSIVVKINFENTLLHINATCVKL